MNLKQCLKEATRQLKAAGVATARLDVLVLLEDVTGKDRAWLLAHPEYEIPAEKARKLTNLFNRRAEHEPLAYLRGRTEFYGRTFLITPAVLEPRPESETMIDLLKELLADTYSKGVQPDKRPRGIHIADVGTGSGALGITAALEAPNTNVDLLDIDSEALKVAKMNVEKFTLNLTLIKNDLLSELSVHYDILLCNLPYVPDSFTINPAAMREPKSAIFGGADGLDLYRRLFDQLKNNTDKPLYILSEALPPQHLQLEEIAAGAGYKLIKSQDFIQLFTTQKI